MSIAARARDDAVQGSSVTTLCLIALLLANTPGAKRAVSEATILGDWCAGSEGAFHEEFTLSVEDGVHVFAAWLHQRPAESGTWTLSKRTLVIEEDSGERREYTIVSATSKRLVIQLPNEKPETYVRPGKCLPFADPPSE
jgi:hypothetical protein